METFALVNHAIDLLAARLPGAASEAGEDATAHRLYDVIAHKLQNAGNGNAMTEFVKDSRENSLVKRLLRQAVRDDPAFATELATAVAAVGRATTSNDVAAERQDAPGADGAARYTANSSSSEPSTHQEKSNYGDPAPRDDKPGSAVRRIFSEMPEQDARRLSVLMDRLVKIEARIDEEIQGIVRACPAYNGWSALVITSGRILDITDSGGLTVIPFSEVIGIRVGPGKKKLFGGFEESYILVDTIAGTRTYPMFDDHAWALKTAVIARSLHEEYRLDAT
ncbi:hypothetical protein [Paractinoplanes durhamensis]|uniref:Uncharacterized protein n=1 Tax=Paractinoplanes durhamensis TaxID=113563 RepID=A0ABQ3YWD1_9ACTN|nr:hypothetical protein [Actinoplanes durhamensis]GIE01840.1 hypothetical protein Adu01nite_31900 [Actinoplanes durhamensis]